MPAQDEPSHNVSPRVAFVTVQYNNLRDTETFLASLDTVVARTDCSVVVVDNSTAQDERAKSGSLQRLTSIRVEVLQPATNLYYWGAAAFALENLMASNATPPAWIVICNNDITIDDRLFVRKLSSLDGARFPIVAPRIVSATTGRDQNPLLESPPGALKRLKWRVYDINYGIARSLLAVHKAWRSLNRETPSIWTHYGQDEKPRTIYAAHGACMIFSTEFFRRGGSLDTSVAMFAEELTVAALATSLELPVWYFPEMRVSHREHSTTGKELTRTKYEMERMARRRYYALTRPAES